MSYVPANFEHHTKLLPHDHFKMETNSASIWNVWGIAPIFKSVGGGGGGTKLILQFPHIFGKVQFDLGSRKHVVNCEI